eukprot:TRINITY_DN4806_c0_g1_i4.p1 TRINITY_DN4806_c0_g1~~TRINITY_DN4806_c0_g1_i4.p1  ORF type:complete len:123 (-),score=41.50 TRINITY_DN4806_c0_g1_i4:109-477(-)
MPFITLMTNMKAASFPADAMPRLIRVLAPLMNKPQEAYNWVLDTDKIMSKGSDNASKPYVWLKIEAIGTFEDPENIKVMTPKLFDFFTNELNIEQEAILMNFYPLSATHIGKNGKTVAQLRA